MSRWILALTVLLAASTAQAQSIPATAAWRFDKGKGGTVKDATGNGHHGELQEVTLSDDTPFGKVGGRSLLFESPTAAVIVDAPFGSALNGMEQLTLMAWIRPTEVVGLHYIFWGDDDTYSMAILNGNLRFGINKKLGGAIPFDTVDRWTHVAATYDGAAVRMYVDGQLVLEKPFAAGDVASLDFRNVVHIGNDETAYFPQLGTDRDFGGNIDDALIATRALSPEEIQQALGGPLSVTGGGGSSKVVRDIDLDMSLPSITRVSGTVPTEAGDIPFSADVAFDGKGRLVSGGSVTVNGIPMSITGKVGLKNGRITWKLKLVSADKSVKLALKGELGSSVARAKYKGAGVKVKIDALPVTVDTGVGNAIATVRLDAQVDEKGKITGSFTIVSGFSGGLTFSGSIKGKITPEKLTLTLKTGPWQVVFRGTREGDHYVGRLQIKIPPEKSVDVSFPVPDLLS